MSNRDSCSRVKDEPAVYPALMRGRSLCMLNLQDQSPRGPARERVWCGPLLNFCMTLRGFGGPKPSGNVFLVSSVVLTYFFLP